MARDRDVVAFIHTYVKDGSFDPFMARLIEAFERAGARLHVLRTNDLVENLAAKSLSHFVSEERLLAFIRRIDPAFILSTNRGGITRRMSEELNIPIIAWLVDHVPFEHDGAHGPYFGPKDHLVVSASRMVPTLRHRYPQIGERVHFLPFATDPRYFSSAPSSARDVDLSFVGSYFYGNAFTELLQRYRSDARIVTGLLAVCKAVEQDFRVDAEPLLKQHGVFELLERHSISVLDLELGMANVASMNKRIRHLDSVADLGLQLWGTDNWVDVAYYSLPLLRCFRFGEFIKTPEQLASIYRRSKIAVDSPHLQAVGGLPYRVFDIMASPALLITEFHPESDLIELFGADVPVPLYRDASDLRAKALYYLHNEDARLAAVRRCNALVAKGFSFEDRVRQLFEIAGRTLPTNHAAQVMSPLPANNLFPNVSRSETERLLLWLRHACSEALQILLLVGVSLAYLCLIFVPPSAVRAIGRPLKRALPPRMYSWLVRELILGNAATRFAVLQEKMKGRVSDLRPGGS